MTALAALLLSVAALQAADLRGLVVDPTGSPVHAVVVVACHGSPPISTTATHGEFTITGPAARSCRVRASAEGFEPLERRCGAGQPASACRLQLRLSRRREEVNVTAPRDDLAAVATGGAMATSFSAADLRVAGPDAGAWLEMAVREAGAPIGAREVRAGGVPSAILPPTRAIGSVTVNADPFSVESSRTDRVRIDLSRATSPQPWHVQVRPPSAHAARDEPLLGSAADVSRDLGVSGGFTTSWSLQLAGTFAFQRLRSTSHPTYLEGPPGSESLQAGLASEDRDTSAYGSLTLSNQRLEFAQTVLSSDARQSNAGIGGAGGVASAVSSESRMRSHQSTWRYAATTWSTRGHLAFDTNRREGRSESSGEGLIAAGRLYAGAADPIAFHTRDDDWQTRVIVEAPQPAGRWLVGVEAVSRRVADARDFNAAGQAIVSADGLFQGHFKREGSISVTAREATAALFAQSVVVRSRRLWLRLGARADWQEGQGTWLSPRVSVATPLGRSIVAGNAGLFVDPWPAEHANELRVRERAPVTWLSPSAGVTTVGRRFRRHDVVARASVIRMFGRIRIAVEETMTLGRNLGGLTRRRDDWVLVDELRGDRSLTRWQSHTRVDLPVRAWMMTGHYSFTHSIDTTDGMFSWPARQSSPRDERGPTTGIARHSVSVTIRGSLPADVQMLVMATASSGTPYTLITGADAEGLLTFTGRADVGRNARRMPARHDVSVYLARRFSLPFAGLGIDAGVRIENLFAATQVLDLDHVASSVYAGAPVRASQGPRFTVWATVGR